MMDILVERGLPRRQWNHVRNLERWRRELGEFPNRFDSALEAYRTATSSQNMRANWRRYAVSGAAQELHGFDYILMLFCKTVDHVPDLKAHVDVDRFTDATTWWHAQYPGALIKAIRNAASHPYDFTETDPDRKKHAITGLLERDGYLFEVADYVETSHEPEKARFTVGGKLVDFDLSAAVSGAMRKTAAEIEAAIKPAAEWSFQEWERRIQAGEINRAGEPL